MTLEFKTYFTIIERSQLYHSLYFLLYSSSMLNKSITCYTSWTCWASILIHSFPSWPADIQGWPWEDWWRTWALLCALAPSPSAETSHRLSLLKQSNTLLVVPVAITASLLDGRPDDPFWLWGKRLSLNAKKNIINDFKQCLAALVVIINSF